MFGLRAKKTNNYLNAIELVVNFLHIYFGGFWILQRSNQDHVSGDKSTTCCVQSIDKVELWMCYF